VQGLLALFYRQVTFPFNVISHLAKSQLLHANNLKGNKCVTRFREPNHILIRPKISIADGTEPKPLKTKIGNALWNNLTVHCFGEKEQNMPDTTGNDDN